MPYSGIPNHQGPLKQHDPKYKGSVVEYTPDRAVEATIFLYDLS